MSRKLIHRATGLQYGEVTTFPGGWSLCIQIAKVAMPADGNRRGFELTATILKDDRRPVWKRWAFPRVERSTIPMLYWERAVAWAKAEAEMIESLEESWASTVK